eukprot:m.508713 g.508713  ORF g.508713 m.508713 type:complete len:350 (+) comp21884_c0_seq3:224-1273(+)
MASARISSAPPPHVDPVKATVAFGDRAIPRLARELQHPSSGVVIQQALFSLCDILRNPTCITPAVDADILPVLGGLLGSNNATIREKSSEALHHIAGHAVGRKRLTSSGLLTPLSKVFSDQVPIVRLNAHTTVERLTKTAEGAHQLLHLELVQQLVQQTAVETEDQVKEVMLDTLKNIAQIDSVPILHSDGMNVFSGLLSSESMGVLCRAANNIMAIAVTLEGKEAALTTGTLPVLVRTLEQHTTETCLQAAVCGALMAITVTTPGKLSAIKEGLVEHLPTLLETSDERALLNAIKLVTVVSEAPAGRRALQAVVPRLKVLTEFRGQRLDPLAIARSAQTAIDTITWTP